MSVKEVNGKKTRVQGGYVPRLRWERFMPMSKNFKSTKAAVVMTSVVAEAH